MSPKLGKLLLIGMLLFALVATDSLARPQRPRRPQRPKKPQIEIHKPQRPQKPQRPRRPQRVRCRPKRPRLPDNYRGRRSSRVDLTDPCQAADNTLAKLQSAESFSTLCQRRVDDDRG